MSGHKLENNQSKFLIDLTLLQIDLEIQTEQYVGHAHITIIF